MLLKRMIVTASLVPALMICHQSVAAKDAQRATITRTRVVKEIRSTFGDHGIRTKDPSKAALVVVAVKFAPPVADLSMDDLTLGFGPYPKEGRAPSLGVTMFASETEDGHWMLPSKDDEVFVFKAPVEHTRVAFELPNEVAEVVLFYKGKAVSDPASVKR